MDAKEHCKECGTIYGEPCTCQMGSGSAVVPGFVANSCKNPECHNYEKVIEIRANLVRQTKCDNCGWYQDEPVAI